MSVDWGRDEEPELFFLGCAEDLQVLSRLCRRELDEPFFIALREMNFPHTLTLLPERIPGSQGDNSSGVRQSKVPDELSEFERALETWWRILQRRYTAAFGDELASDYAEVFLTGHCGGSPEQSFWTDPDHLRRQGSYLEMKALLKDHGRINSMDQTVSADHLSIQLEFASSLLRELSGKKETEDSRNRLAWFLEQKILDWLPLYQKELRTLCPNNPYRFVIDGIEGYLRLILEYLKT